MRPSFLGQDRPETKQIGLGFVHCGLLFEKTYSTKQKKRKKTRFWSLKNTFENVKKGK